MSVNKFGAGLKSVSGKNTSYIDNKLKALLHSKVNKAGGQRIRGFENSAG